ncbi:MAG: DUF262 domain-containing protein [Bacillota bacterium]|nr:DUF262 domain-containing protein [Bacillota bacterium]
MENNKMVSFNNIMDNCFKSYDVYIPLIQRNYKWDTVTAAKLAVDLWSAFKKEQTTYTVSMITFYKEPEDHNQLKNFKPKMQLIDGQQRIITLFMLLKYIMPDEEYFSFGFERDEGIKESKLNRKSYLTNIAFSNSWEEKDMYTDLIRFKNNYEAIKTALETAEPNAYETGYANKFADYIRKNVYFLMHISETEPFDEFINLNKNKTRFVISDRIKANLIIDSKEKNNKEKVLNLFQNLSEILFSKKDVWELVQQGYCETKIPERDEKRKKNKHYPDENRLKLLCCERYGSDEFDVSSTLGYEPEKEFAFLTQYSDILSSLCDDISNQNWNSYNAYNCLHKLKNELRFFGMLEKNTENTQGRLEGYLLNEFKNMTEPFTKACFIESQLGDEKLSFDYIDNHKNICEEFNNGKTQTFWLNNGKAEFEIFMQIYSAYIDEKYNNKG